MFANCGSQCLAWKVYEKKSLVCLCHYIANTKERTWTNSRYSVNVCEWVTSTELQWVVKDRDVCFLVFHRYFCSLADQGQCHIQTHLDRMPNILLYSQFLIGNLFLKKMIYFIISGRKFKKLMANLLTDSVIRNL